MQSGEACWDLPDDHFSMATGSQAVIFPAGTPPPHRERRLHARAGCSGWCSSPRRSPAAQRPPVPRPRDRGAVRDGRRPGAPDRPARDVPRTLGDLCARLTDERLLIGSAPIMAEVRSKVYSSVISMWKTRRQRRRSGAQRGSCARPSALLRESAEGRLRGPGREDRGDRPPARLRQEPALQPVHPRGRDGAQRLSPAHAHQALLRTAVQTADSVTAIGIDSGFRSSQYFSRVFKKYVGVTPTDYRQLFGRGPVPAWLATCVDRRARGGRDMSGRLAEVVLVAGGKLRENGRCRQDCR